jgi:peptide/nickel transport system substrate-binding protein
MIRRLAVVLALMTLAACGGQAPPPGVIRMGVQGLPPSFGDPYRGEGAPSSYTWQAVFDGLTYLAPDGEVKPALATAWETTDGKTWRFTLRRGVTFSNGVPFDSAAAAATLNWLTSKAGLASVVGGRMRDVAKVETPASDVLVVTLRAPDVIFHKRLPSVAIVEPGAWKRLGPTGFAKAPVGTGPYRWVRTDERARRILLEANPGAWRKARTPGLEIVELTDEAVRQQALISGDVDIARVGLEDVELLEARGVHTLPTPSMQVMSLAFVTEGRDGPLDDVRVRQALNYAVDKAALSKVLLKGYGAAAGQGASKGTVGYDPALKPYPYDPARARALLAEAGYPNGFPMKVESIVGSLPADTLIYQAVARDLERVGVPVDLRAIPFPVFLRRYLANDWDVDAFGLSWNAGPYNDVQRPLENFSCIKRPKPFFCDRALAAQIRAAGAELDPEARLARLKALAAAHQKAAPALFLVEQVDVMGFGPRVRGLKLANRVPVYEEILLSR